MPSQPTAFAATPELAKAAIEQKKLARANDSQRNLSMLFVSVVVFAVFAAAGWFSGGDLASLQRWAVPGVLIGSVVGALVAASLRRAKAACPACHHNWEIKGGRATPPQDQMENWDKCPGCGLLMADWALQRAVDGKPRL